MLVRKILFAWYFFYDHLVHRENGLVVVGDTVLQVSLHVDLALVQHLFTISQASKC